MFNFFKKKKKEINTAKVRNFNNAMKIIEDFVSLEEFDKALRWIDEIIDKENKSFSIHIDKIKEKEKKKEINKFNKKIKKLKDKKSQILNKKTKYEIKTKLKKIELEKNYLKKELPKKILSWDIKEATYLLNTFLSKNKDNVDCIKFVNSQKEKINKLLEKIKKQKEKSIKKNAYMEARELLWDIKVEKEQKKDKKDISLSNKIKYIFKSYINIAKTIKEKRLLNEVSFLIETQKYKNEWDLKSKLATIHSWISKEISWFNINWYDIYWKILWADKISWDSIWFHESKKDYTFFIWDATWHGIKAWFIITQLTKRFDDLVKKFSLEKICMEVNNSLKQELKSWNFITSVFFNIEKKDPSKIFFVWMWHEPMFLYKKKLNEIQKVIPWWLASWIRIIKDLSSIHKKTINLEDWDVLLTYTDGIIEEKNENSQMYWFERIQKKFKELAQKWYDTNSIYNQMVDDLKSFKWWISKFNDDVTLLVIKRDEKKQILKETKEIEDILEKQWLDKKLSKKMKWKNKEEIFEALKKEQKIKETKNIIRALDVLYKTWELPKLKQDCIKYIREWYIHKKINFFLKKSLENEENFKLKQKNKKLQDKYNVLKELYNKWDYETVIRECSDIISKDWNI